MRWVWIVVMLAACGRSHFDDAALDTNNPSGHDFDGDGIDDAVDNCPAQFNTNQADEDGDHVGDGCDPHPSSPGDQLISRGLFSEGFGDWIPDDIGNWSLASGKAETATAPDATQSRLSITHPLGKPTIELAFVIESYGAPAGEDVSVTASYPSSSWGCHALDDAGNNEINAVRLTESAVQRNEMVLGGLVHTGSLVTMRFSRESIVSCTLGGVTTSFDAMSVAQGTPAVITIEVVGLQVGVVYAMVYD